MPPPRPPWSPQPTPPHPPKTPPLQLPSHNDEAASEVSDSSINAGVVILTILLMGGMLLLLTSCIVRRYLATSFTLTRPVTREEARAFDEALIACLDESVITLIRVSFLRQMAKGDPTWRLPRLQELHEIDGALIAKDDAVALLERADRSIFALSHGWLSAKHPDPCGNRLRALCKHFDELDARGVLPSDAGLFWDYGSLPQKPRSSDDEQKFQTALRTMADVYYSPMGTCVLITREVPPIPKGRAGEYNERPYELRGWCVAEEVFSTECLLKLQLQPLERAKAVDIFETGKCAAVCPIPRSTEQVLERLDKASFTGSGDKAVVERILIVHEELIHKRMQYRSNNVRLSEGSAVAGSVANRSAAGDVGAGVGRRSRVLPEP